MVLGCQVSYRTSHANYKDSTNHTIVSRSLRPTLDGSVRLSRSSRGKEALECAFGAWAGAEFWILRYSVHSMAFLLFVASRLIWWIGHHSFSELLVCGATIASISFSVMAGFSARCA